MSFDESDNNVTHSIELRKAHEELKRASDLRMLSKQQQAMSGTLSVLMVPTR
jgi:hypothetical protein